MRQKALVFSLTFLTLCFALAKAVGAQTFSLVPSTATKSAGLEFSVDLNINTGGKKVSAADVKLTFNSTILQVTQIQDGTFFTDTSHNIYSGTLYIGGSFADEAQSASGSGKLATLTMKGKTVGTGQLAFVCSSQTTDTNIFDTSATPVDIVNCSGTQNGSYVITGTAVGDVGLGGGVETEGTTPAPEAPVTGISWPTFFSLAFGFCLAVVGLVLIF